MTLTRLLKPRVIPALFIVTALLAGQAQAVSGVVLDASTRTP